MSMPKADPETRDFFHSLLPFDGPGLCSQLSPRLKKSKR